MDGQSGAVTAALVGADLDLAPDVRGDLATEITLGLVVRLDPVTQLDQLILGEILDADVPTDPGVRQGLLARVRPMPKT